MTKDGVGTHPALVKSPSRAWTTVSTMLELDVMHGRAIDLAFQT